MAVDSLLTFRAASAGALTADFTSDPVDIGAGGTPLDGLFVQFNVPANTTAGDKLDASVTACTTSGGSYTTVSTLDQIDGATAKGVYFIPVNTKKRYLKLVLNGTDGAADGFDFGTVTAYVVNAEDRRKAAQ